MSRNGQSGQTIASVFAAQTAALGHRPLLTFYDDRSGERTELSYATFFNWASKAANLLVEELGLDRGGTVAVRVADHWTGAVLTVATWMVGACVSFDLDETVGVLVVSQAEAADHSAHPALLVVGDGMGGRLTMDAPGVGFGDEVLAFGDDYSDPDVSADDPALGARTHAALTQAVDGLLAADDRLLATARLHPGTVAAVLVAPALAGASVVWCPAAGDLDLSERITAERVTKILGDDGTVGVP